MRKIILNTLLLSTLVNPANAVVHQIATGSYEVGGMTGEHLNNCNGGRRYIDESNTTFGEFIGIFVCGSAYTTSSLPTAIYDQEGVEMTDPEIMAALVDGDAEVASEVAAHFQITSEKLFETVSILEEADVEVTLENIGNNL